MVILELPFVSGLTRFDAFFSVFMVYFESYYQLRVCSLWTARLFPVFATRLDSSQYAIGMLNCLKSGVKFGEYDVPYLHVKLILA